MNVKMSNLKSLLLLHPFFISRYSANKVKTICFDVVCTSIPFLLLPEGFTSLSPILSLLLNRFEL